MLVRIMSGREAGSIQDIPFHAAEVGIIMGSFAKVTDDEIAAEGIGPKSQVEYASPEAFPEGYSAKPSEAGAGFDVIDPSGAQINQDPFPNLPAARDGAAADILKKQNAVSAADGQPDRKALEKLTRAELEEIAKAKGIDASQAKNKAEILDMLAPLSGDPGTGAATGDNTGSGAPE